MTQPVPPPGGTPAGPSGPRADFWYRLGGFLVDGVILYVIGLVIGLIFSGNVVSQILISLAAGIAYSVYFIGSGSGQTPGMRLLNIRAVDAVTGGRVDYGRAFVRYLVGIVSQLSCYLGYFWMLWDTEKQTWHDKVAGTYVVPTSAYPVERWPG
ncbi:MAG TPA: RDD family protein [Vicinamibacterales bacterium]|nr:RDD family protein [Vicinamibacterales bacterium]